MEGSMEGFDGRFRQTDSIAVIFPKPRKKLGNARKRQSSQKKWPFFCARMRFIFELCQEMQKIRHSSCCFEAFLPIFQ